jgi:hypothetical protein
MKAANFFPCVLVPTGVCTQCHIQEKRKSISATARILIFQLVVCYTHFPLCFAFSRTPIIITHHICFKLGCDLSQLFSISLKQRSIRSGTGWTVSCKIHPLVSTYTGQSNKINPSWSTRARQLHILKKKKDGPDPLRHVFLI